MLNIPCILFAGGKSSRMGKDKSLLPFGNFSTLTEFQLHKLQKIFTNVYISCKDKNKFHFSTNFIEDIQVQNNTYAPTIGFISSFHTLSCERFFAISVDTPFINHEQIQLLFDSDTAECDATIAKTNNSIHPLCGIYHISLKSKFEEMIKEGNHKLKFLLDSSKTNYVNFNESNSFFNINNQDEYNEALSLINTTTV